MTTPTFTAHNIRLDDGSFTKPDEIVISSAPWFLSAKRVLLSVFSGERSSVRIADLGCLEGGYSVEFARLGFDVLGLDVRTSNIEACKYVKSKTDLPRLQFVQDNVWNLANHGRFDAVFCCGLLYHLDQPRRFIDLLNAATKKLLILQTHFSVAHDYGKGARAAITDMKPFRHIRRHIRGMLRPGRSQPGTHGKFRLSEIAENEGLQGRWYQEFKTDEAFQKRESSRWASWDNKRSFWIQREYLIEAIHKAGFDAVFEQFDSLGDDIASEMLQGYYKTDTRGTFIGLKL
jgi:SAM-dependent methyltransferase